jgi:DNA-binding NtrC family response regulator
MLPDHHSVLIVDDDPLILAAFRRVTRDLAVRMRFAATSQEAWAAVNAEVPEVIIADYRLPDGDGLTFLEKVQTQWPEVKCVLHTGEAVNRTAVGLDIPVLAKPCPPETLRELISSVIEDLKAERARKT